MNQKLKTAEGTLSLESTLSAVFGEKEEGKIYI